MGITQHVFSGFSIAFGVVAVRTFPFLAAFLADTGGRRWQKALAFTAYTVVASATVWVDAFQAADLAAAYVFLFAASIVAYWLVPRVPAGWGLLALAALFLGVPALVSAGETAMLLIGWEVMLAAYSYCRRERAVSQNLGAYWFFVFVNPTFSFPARGTQVSQPGLQTTGLARMAQGTLALALSGSIASVSAHVVTGAISAPSACMRATLRIADLYAAHWGLASLQIGAVRQLGWVVPERYEQPYRARSPREFWARWNTHVGAWGRVHVFRPLVRWLTRRIGTAPQRSVLIGPLAVVATFGAIGTLHDLYGAAATRTLSFGMTAWFVVNALVIVAWDAMSARVARVSETAGARFARFAAMLGLIVVLAVTLP